MSKAVYAFLTYPESCETIDMIQRLSEWGVPWAHSPVHDKDKFEKPMNGVEFKKPHVHWIVGFEKNPPTLSDFVLKIRAFGGVAAVRETVCKNPWKAVEYFNHKNNPEKYQYTDAPVFSEMWNIDSYVTTEQIRQHRQEQKKASKMDENLMLMTMLSWCGRDTGQFSSFYTLTKYVVDSQQNYFDVLRKNAFFVREYINSMIVDMRVSSADREAVDKMKLLVDGYEAEITDLKARLEFAEQSAKTYYEQLFGESLPDSWEWGNDDNTPLEGSPLEQIGMTEDDFQ